MGLDMFAHRRHYVKQWEHEKAEKRYSVTVTRGDKPIEGVNPKLISYVVEEVMYWRKANQIHQWFVANVQNGVDDCGEYYVEEEKLDMLYDACERVIKASELVPAADAEARKVTTIGPTGVMACHIPKVIKDPRVAKELLLVQQGFFFGSYEYDEHYLNDVIDTRNWLDRMKADQKCLHYTSIFYSSSW